MGEWNPDGVRRLFNAARWDADQVREHLQDPSPMPGVSVTYWGPDIKVGPPQPALNAEMDAHTNVKALHFTFDKEAKEVQIVFIQNEMTEAPCPIPIPDITPLNPPLGLIPTVPPRITPLTHTAKLSPLRGALHGVAYAAQHADAVTGTGTLSVLRYGRVVKAREFVGVRGAGPAFDVLYYVRSVTHILKQGEYKENFTLTRNGLLSTFPRVPA